MKARPPEPKAEDRRVRTTASRVLLASALLLFPVALATPPSQHTPGLNEAPWNAWVGQQASNVSGNFFELELALDSHGEPHFANIDAGPCQGFACYTPETVYTRHTAMGWQTDVVRTNSGALGLALDSNDTPHIIMYDSKTFQLMYGVRQANGSWTVETIGQAGSPDVAQIRMDGNDRPHIMFTTGPGSVQYVTKPDPNRSWVINTVYTNEYSYWMSLAIDKTGRAHFTTNGNTLIYGTERQDGSFAIERPGNTSCGGPVLALDRSDFPHIFCGGRNVDYYWSRDVNATWSSEAVRFENDHNLGLVIDSYDRPHITWSYPPGGSLTRPITGDTLGYAQKTENGWQFESPFRIAESIYCTAIAIDANNRPHIVFTLGQLTNGASAAGIGGTASAWYVTPAVAQISDTAREVGLPGLI